MFLRIFILFENNAVKYIANVSEYNNDKILTADFDGE